MPNKMNNAEAYNGVFSVITIQCGPDCPCCKGLGCDLSRLREDPQLLSPRQFNRLMEVRSFVLRFYKAEPLGAN